MRVLLIGDYPPPSGGIAIHVAQLQAYLRERGIEVRVLDIGRGGRPAPDVIPARAPRLFGLRLAQFLAGGWLVHLHTSGNNRTSWVVALATAAAALPFPARSVLTVHSGLCPPYLARSGANRLLAHAALGGFARVVAVSPQVGQSLQRAGGPRVAPLILPAFLSTLERGQLPPGFAHARARRRLLVAMGYHPSPVYGLELMFEALAKVSSALPGVGLALLGPGSDGPRVWEAAARVGIADRLELFGELPHERALGLISGCDLFVRPTSADGDSLSVREALSLGVPVLASDVVPRPSGTLLFRAGDPASLARAMTSALGAAPRPALPASSSGVGEALLALYQGMVTEQRGGIRNATPA